MRECHIKAHRNIHDLWLNQIYFPSLMHQVQWQEHKHKRKENEQFCFSCPCAYVERVTSENSTRQISGLVFRFFLLNPKPHFSSTYALSRTLGHSQR